MKARADYITSPQP